MRVIKNQKAFTVLELMVVIGIMVMMLLLTIPNFQNFDKNQILETEADKLFSVLRQAQVWALTGQTVSGTRYNFGVHFNSTCVANACNYVFFKDLKDPINPGDKRYDQGEEYGIGINSFGRGVYASAINPNSDGLDIVFEAPSGAIYFNGVVADESSATITLTSSVSGKTKTITVNGSSGQINIQ
jgi:type II secretory pathway pseudopilin PulG